MSLRERYLLELYIARRKRDYLSAFGAASAMARSYETDATADEKTKKEAVTRALDFLEKAVLSGQTKKVDWKELVKTQVALLRRLSRFAEASAKAEDAVVKAEKLIRDELKNVKETGRGVVFVPEKIPPLKELVAWMEVQKVLCRFKDHRMQPLTPDKRLRILDLGRRYRNRAEMREAIKRWHREYEKDREMADTSE